MNDRTILPQTEELSALLAELGEVEPTALADTRTQLHCALQPVASVGFTLVEPGEDFEHTTLRFDQGRLRSQLTSEGLSAAMNVEQASLSLLDPDGKPLESSPLAGRTIDEMYETMGRWLNEHGHSVDDMVRPTHDLPDHAVGAGVRYAQLPAGHLRELTRWFALASAVTHAIAEHEPRAGAVYMWPHHFDMATLLSLGGERSVGVGLTPGDSSYPEPYVYVTPWPYPAADALPPLGGGGQWHTQGWTGAVLPGSVLLDNPPEARRDALEAFLRTALTATLER